MSDTRGILAALSEPTPMQSAAASSSSSSNTTNRQAVATLADQFATASLSASSSSESSSSTSYIISDSELTWGSSIGWGGFATVYKGSRQGKDVAIKQYNECSSESYQQYFDTEFSIMKKLTQSNAPHMVPFYGKIETKPCCLVMKYIPQDLEQLLNAEPRLDWGHRYQLARDTAEFLVFSSSLNIVHRDIKAKNILVDADKRANICDFGCSIDDPSSYDGNNAGSFRHAAPEVLAGDSSTYSTKYDIYSFGITLWEIANPKQKLYNGHGHAIVTSAVLYSNARPEIADDCPAGFKNLMKQCWFREPEKRPNAETILHIMDTDPEITAAIQKIKKNGL